MIHRLSGRVAGVVSLFTLILVGCDPAPTAPPGASTDLTKTPSSSVARIWRVGLLHPGRENDRGWNQLAYEALLELDRRDDVSARHAFTPNRSNFKADLRAFAEQNYDLVICHGGEFAKAAREVARQYPKTRFVVAGSEEAGDGIAAIDFRLWEATYLCGVLAACVVPDGPAGLIGGEDFRPVRNTLDAFASGARSVRPDYPTFAQYVGSWEDVARANQTARSLIEAYRVKVIFQNTDAAAFGVFQAARDAGVLAFGSNSDQNGAAPENVLASAVIDMAEAYRQLLERVMAGKLGDDVVTHDLKSGGVRFVPNPRLESKWPAGARERIDAARKKIESGELKVL